jgi:hypothetical protein
MSRQNRSTRSLAVRGLRLAALLLVATQLTVLAQAEVQVLASQDNWVNKKEKDSTHPTSTTLALRGHEGRSDAKEMFVRFEVPDLAINGAELSLYRHNITGNNTLEIATVDTDADVDTFTWNNRPTDVTVVQTISIANGSGPETYDLTGVVQPGEQLTLRFRLLAGENTWGWGWFFSRENSDEPNRPYLVLDADTGGDPGTQYCCADPGSCNTCPCGNGNDGSMGCAGCANSAYTSGASLSGTGEASLSGDSLALHVTRACPSNSVMFFQGKNDLNCSGVFLGDGLRCAGGGLVRLQVRFTDQYGDASSTVTVSQRSAMFGDVLMPGTTRYYQAWYRDVAGFPCDSGSNSTNGYAVTWQP